MSLPSRSAQVLKWRPQIKSRLLDAKGQWFGEKHFIFLMGRKPTSDRILRGLQVPTHTEVHVSSVGSIACLLKSLLEKPVRKMSPWYRCRGHNVEAACLDIPGTQPAGRYSIRMKRTQHAKKKHTKAPRCWMSPKWSLLGWLTECWTSCSFLDCLGTNLFLANWKWPSEKSFYTWFVWIIFLQSWVWVLDHWVGDLSLVSLKPGRVLLTVASQLSQSAP